MAILVCGNINCKFKGDGNLCGRDTVTLNPFGCCSIWWDKKKPEPRMGPRYAEGETCGRHELRDAVEVAE